MKKDPDCRFCKPNKNNKSYWEEDGFYGYQCFECTGGKTAIVATIEHKEDISPEEKKTLHMLIDKHYSDLTPKVVPHRSLIFKHYYEFLVKK